MKKNNISRFSWLGFASIGMLLTIITFFTVSTLSKQEETVNLLIAERAIAFIDVYEKVIITSTYSGLPFDLAELTEDLAESQNFNFTMVTDEDGVVLLHSDRNLVGKQIDLEAYFKMPIEEESMAMRPSWKRTEILGKENILVYKKLHVQRTLRNQFVNITPFIGTLPSANLREENIKRRSREESNRQSRTGYDFSRQNEIQSNIAKNFSELNRLLFRDNNELSINEYMSPIPSLNPVSMALNQRKEIFIFVAHDMSMHNQSRLNSAMMIVFASVFIALAAIILLGVMQYIERNETIQIRQAEKLLAISDLTAGVAHEIRNPLSSIKGYATFFKQKFPENSTEQEAASIMADEVDRLNRAIDNLVGLSRTIDIRLESVSITEICTKICLLLEAEFLQNNIQIQFTSDKNKDIIAEIDPDKLKQALLNLLLNAMDAFNNTDIEDKVIKLDVAKKNKQILISVSDNGMGIKKEIRDRVFDPYFTTKTQGTGLGLAMVKNIIEAHNGSLELIANDTKTRGSTFIIHLPV